MKILLFDIDGTLVTTSGAGKAAMEQALRTAFALNEINDTVPYSGRTDYAIGRDLLRAHRLDDTDNALALLTETYLSHLPMTLAQKGGAICPGIVELLSRVQGKPDYSLGLLTGNMRRGAAIKLGHFTLWDHFAFGGFGDQRFDRNDVARAAVEACTQHHGRSFDMHHVYIIGDTPLDVACARAVGARAVAVATGWDSYDTLAACQPDYLYHDLCNPTELLTEWGFSEKLT